MTPVRMAEAALEADRIHDDPAIWITRLPDAAILARARALEAEGPMGRPLWGVPFAVKDNIDVAGLPTTAACPGFAYVAETDAPAVRRLLDAGALLIGKTNLDQFATGLVGTRSPYGIPRNVFDRRLVPGGSSSGSACAVAAGIVPFALGTDTAGSGRVPAALGNIVGLKPTIGSVSARGMVPACRSLDTISVFARSVDEALRVQRLIAVYDEQDPYARPAPFAHLRRAAPSGAVRVAMGDVADLCVPAVAGAFGQAGRFLGATPVDLSLFLDLARQLYDGPWVAERTAALRGAMDRSPDMLFPVTRTILELGLERCSADAFDAFHLQRRARREAERLFAEYDAVLVPTAPFTATLMEDRDDPIGPNKRMGLFTNFANLCDLAAFAVPIGFGSDGMPVGGTLLGPAWSEGRLAPIADRLHRRFADTVGATGKPVPPAAAPDALAADEMALFCIGAHMSGLPLNTQVTGLGGRFLRTAATAPGYRLYALGNRPGLVRSADGAAIEGEVWALPAAAIGPLLALIPPPLGFGTVQLDDGPCLGFLAETEGVADATDITRFGGWRAWLHAGERA
ncbi:MAG TPA: allophanate hydrolase [Rhodopila sp.]|uniref:allophanate hydrolase n=1 Tax=Rhodopila sp. TaxID=2480087 RepID=UPI002BEBA08B|nr:allophanate hydrolase [Rhodopila sp.]HVY17780.1 allophanate hydrolase [Rhodopila sp.]